MRTDTAPFQNKPRLICHFFQGSTATARYRLVGADHDSLHGIDLMQGIERDHHLDGRALRTGNYPLVQFYILRIDLRNYQGHFSAHPEGAAIINDHCASFRSQRRQPATDIGITTEKGNIDISKCLCFGFPDLNSSMIEQEAHPGRMLRG